VRERVILRCFIREIQKSRLDVLANLEPIRISSRHNIEFICKAIYGIFFAISFQYEL
jgi:hypothetical protein